MPENPSPPVLPGSRTKLAAAGIVVLALLLVPAPLLSPHRLAEAVQSILGVGWKAACLMAAIGLHLGFYGSLGALAALAVHRAATWRGRLLQIAVVPLAVVALAVVIRSVKLGHVPMLTNAVVPIAGCLLKEELDALTRGSGFSFGDLAADRAGVRFAAAAACSEANARAMQARLRGGFVVDDFFPPASDFPENLTVEQFRQEYGGVGSQRCREKFGEIEARLDRCAGLSTSRYTQ